MRQENEMFERKAILEGFWTEGGPVAFLHSREAAFMDSTRSLLLASLRSLGRSGGGRRSPKCCTGVCCLLTWGVMETGSFIGIPIVFSRAKFISRAFQRGGRRPCRDTRKR